MSAPDFCPNCGAEIPQGAKCCPECGSDEETGWSEQARYDALDLPDDQFDHDDFVRREFEPDRFKPRGMRWFWWLVAAGVLAAFLVFTLRFR
ncbi:MAG TPA: zinc-ribbon domain-containing protein [Verrucomicrobiota bacterium]|nr:zinc-ribbon domain-containing protein [Verrucomicrobiota bacterium]HOK78702.1 zinc-ribbon domain-containing protein [Verrucomicrobiota bacterium]